MLQSTLQSQTKSILNSNGYHSIRRLGKGGFGHVLLATKSTSSSTFYAVKCISKRNMSRDPQLRRFLLQEINTMAQLQHPNIVRLLKTFEQGEWYFLVLEYCDMGNLQHHLSRLPHHCMTLQDGVSTLKQLLNGIEAIHHRNIIHRDIKQENIMLKRNEKGGFTCKIGDFGLARPIDDDHTALTNCGTESYMAPEILAGLTYGRQADIWSLGVLLHSLLLGDFPFKGINILDEIHNRCKNGFKMAENKVRGAKDKAEQLLLCDLFAKIFEIQPSKRITIAELWQHKLLKPRQKEKTEQSSTTTITDEDEQNVLEWQLARIQFIQRIVDTVVTHNFLSFYLTTAFKFYTNKVILHFLSRPQIKALRANENNANTNAQIIIVQQRIHQQLAIQYSLLLKNQQTKEPIDRFEDGFNTEVQEFASFKMAYRNTIGRVYEQVHRKLSDNLPQRASLKLKLFLCHIINRVFSGPVNPAVLPFYIHWVKRHNINISERLYDFHSIEEWIKQERPDNLQRSQDTINQVFYK